MVKRPLPGAPTDPNPPAVPNPPESSSLPTDQSPPPKPSPPPESAPTEQDPPPLHTLPAAMEPRVGQVLVGRYRLVKRLGAGGMGVVFQARDEELTIDVALKILPVNAAKDRVAIERFRKEVTLVRDIPHAGVCRVYEFREDGPVPFFTMELIAGRTLRQVMREGEPQTADVYALLLQIAKALEAVHAKRVVHRDLKPDNVLVRPNGEAVLVDFGLAKNSLAQGATTTGIAGTPKYMSPEQLSGEHLDVRTDVFAFGVMAFELLSGRAPFGTGSDARIVTAILRDPPAKFECAGVSSEVERSLQSFFSATLAKSPSERFASAAEMRAAFEEAWAGTSMIRISSELPPPVKLPSMPVPLQARHSRRWWLSIPAAAVLFATVAWVFVPPPSEVKLLVRIEKSFLACDPTKPTVEVLPFKNSSGDAEWEGFANSVADSLRGHLRPSPKLHMAEPSMEFGQCPTRWVVDGSVQKIGDKLRLSVEVHDGAKGSLVPPIEVDGVQGETGKVLEKARDILLDDLRRQARFKERDWRAYFGTKNEQARKHLFDYYRLVGANPQPRKEDLEVGKKLLDDALVLDPDYVMALVERAYLLSLGAGGGSRLQGVNAGLRDLERAFATAPDNADVLVMRCRLSRETVEVGRKPTDEKIDAALTACNAALTADPGSAQVRFAYARLYERLCDEQRAIESFEQVLPLDRSMSDIVLRVLINAALHNGRLLLADRRSMDLLELEKQRRDGAPAGRGAHLLRGAVLMRLGERDSTLLAKAKHEFEVEIERANANIGEHWFEAAAIRGLMRLAKRGGSQIPTDLVKRLVTLERDAERAAFADPYVVIRILGTYQHTDPEAALEWLEKLGPPAVYDEFGQRVFLLQEANRHTDALKLLATFEPKQRWEQNCHAWIRGRSGN